MRPPVPRCICNESESECRTSRSIFISQRKTTRSASARTVSAKSAMTVKYASAAAAYNLKDSCVPVSQPYTQPVTFNQRTGHQVKPELHELQSIINDFQTFTNENSFVINKRKCEVMVFNFSKKYAFPPDISIGNSHIISEVNYGELLAPFYF